MKTFLDWTAYKDAGMGDAYADIPKRGGDYAKAVAVCINSRQCEEDTGRGVMCPSYRVTGDPDHTPGGRVRLLKRALNHPSDDAVHTDPELAASMALCVACKGCKRECENSVDVAQIKLEYLAQRHAKSGPSLRTRLFAHLPRWLNTGQWFSRAVALRNRVPWLRRLGRKVLGISERRLPEAAPQPFVAASVIEKGDNRVVLFVDTFTRYYEPENAEAAIEVLRAGGYDVIVVKDQSTDKPLCCGRTYLAHGLLEKARAEAERTLHALAPHVDAGLPVLGLEPSCLLALRDDYRALGLGPAAENLSRQSWLFEEFLAREWSSGRLTLPLRDDDKDAPVLVHGHCHQKAVGAMKSMRKVLKSLPGVKFRFIESSCCGMAGSFGYEAEHESLSRRMAELGLLPTVRAEPHADVVANGFSCRQQIREGSDRGARHLAQLLRERLAPVDPSRNNLNTGPEAGK